MVQIINNMINYFKWSNWSYLFEYSEIVIFEKWDKVKIRSECLVKWPELKWLMWTIQWTHMWRSHIDFWIPNSYGYSFSHIYIEKI